MSRRNKTLASTELQVGLQHKLRCLCRGIHPSLDTGNITIASCQPINMHCPFAGIKSGGNATLRNRPSPIRTSSQRFPTSRENSMPNTPSADGPCLMSSSKKEDRLARVKALSILHPVFVLLHDSVPLCTVQSVDTLQRF